MGEESASADRGVIIGLVDEYWKVLTSCWIYFFWLNVMPVFDLFICNPMKDCNFPRGLTLNVDARFYLTF